MFLDENAIHIDGNSFDMNLVFEEILKNIAEDFDIESIVLCIFNSDTKSFSVIISYNISSAIFDGRDKSYFFESVEDCFETYPKPHVHKVNNNLINVLKKIEPSKTYSYRMIFLPIVFKSNRYLFLGFLKSKETKQIPEELIISLKDIIVTVDILQRAEDLELTLTNLQNHVKEVGHDISSSVQSTIAKLSNISRGIFTGKSAISKIEESKEEILNTFREAKNLGMKSVFGL